MNSYDVVGRIAIVKFPEHTGRKEKKIFAGKLLENKNIKTVLEKVGKVSGRLRTIKTRFLAGLKTRETIHKESGCLFKLNIEKCYFSPRLSNERLEIAKEISGGKVLVLFAGVAPFSIVIAKLARVKVVSVELGRECCKYAKENVKLNKLADKIEIIQKDVKKLKLKERFDYIVMPRPQLKDTFLKQAFSFSKKNTRIFYYDFGKEPGEILEKINREASKCRKKIKIENVKKAGEIAPYSYRWRVDMTLLN